MEAITLKLASYKKYFIKYCEWYKLSKPKVELKVFLLYPFEYQLGYFLQFLNENNIHIFVGVDFYIIYSITAVNKNSVKNILVIEEESMATSLLQIYETTIIQSFKYLTTPF